MSKLTRKEKKAFEQRMQAQKALNTLKDTVRKFKNMNNNLSQRMNELDRSIMENLAKGDEFQAQLDCAALKECKKQSRLYCGVAMIINNKMLRVEQELAVGEAAGALAIVNDLKLDNPVDIMGLFREEKSDSLSSIAQQMLSNMDQDEEVTAILDQYKRRLAQGIPSIPVPPSSFGETVNSTSRIAG